MRKIAKIISSHQILAETILVIVVAFAGLFLFKYIPSPQAPVKKTSASTFNYACDGDPQSFSCIQQQYKTITQTQGATEAFKKLKADYKTNPNIVADCHQLAHVIGRTEADSVQDVDTAYSQGDNFCWSGYYHGVMESIVVKIGINNLNAKLPTICAGTKTKRQYSFYHYNCVHGLGHGIMNVNGSKLFDSLQTCDRLTDEWERQSCYGGVFMENVMDEVNPSHKTLYFKVGQPMYPCTDVGEKYKESCYLMQTSHALGAAGGDFAQVFNECEAVDSNYIDTCYQSLGRDASGSSSSNVDQTKASCMLGQDEDARINCVIGAVRDFISYYHDDSEANKLCLSLISSMQETCQTTKSQYFSTL